jgi:hypothetical protein
MRIVEMKMKIPGKWFVLIIVLLGCTGACSNQKHEYSLFYQYDLGITEARNSNRMIFLIFDLWSASNSNPDDLLGNSEIIELLENFVVIHLMVDDEVSIENCQIQKKVYGINYQPAYFILNSSAQILRGPIGYCTAEQMKAQLNNLVLR